MVWCVCVCVCVLLFVYLPEPGLRFCSGFSLAVSRWGLLLFGGGASHRGAFPARAERL